MDIGVQPAAMPPPPPPPQPPSRHGRLLVIVGVGAALLLGEYGAFYFSARAARTRAHATVAAVDADAARLPIERAQKAAAFFNRFCAATDAPKPRRVDLSSLGVTDISQLIARFEKEQALDLLELTHQQLQRILKQGDSPVLRQTAALPATLQAAVNRHEALLEKKFRGLKAWGATANVFPGSVDADGETLPITELDQQCYTVTNKKDISVEEAGLHCGFFSALDEEIAQRQATLVQELAKQRKHLEGMDLGDLKRALALGSVSPAMIPQGLYFLGEKLIDMNRSDDALQWYTCAAEHYLEPISMVRLAELYFSGSKSIQAAHPEMVFATPIQPDYGKAYFWISSAFQVAPLSATNLIKVLELLDKLQYASEDQTLKGFDSAKAEGEMAAFLTKRYPQIFDLKDIRSHKLSAYLEGIQNLQLNAANPQEAKEDQTLRDVGLKTEKPTAPTPTPPPLKETVQIALDPRQWDRRETKRTPEEIDLEYAPHAPSPIGESVSIYSTRDTQYLDIDSMFKVFVDGMKKSDGRGTGDFKPIRKSKNDLLFEGTITTSGMRFTVVGRMLRGKEAGHIIVSLRFGPLTAAQRKQWITILQNARVITQK